MYMLYILYFVYPSLFILQNKISILKTEKKKKENADQLCNHVVLWNPPPTGHLFPSQAIHSILKVLLERKICLFVFRGWGESTVCNVLAL